MLNLIIATGLVASTSAPAAAQDGWENVTSTRTAATYCVVSESVRLDDRTTSPDIIARGAFRACQAQVRNFDQAFRAKAIESVPRMPTSEMDDRLKPMVEEQHRDMQDLAIQAVLENRVKNRAPNH